jgi:hypothetical protein
MNITIEFSLKKVSECGNFNLEIFYLKWIFVSIKAIGLYHKTYYGRNLQFP